MGNLDSLLSDSLQIKYVLAVGSLTNRARLISHYDSKALDIVWEAWREKYYSFVSSKKGLNIDQQPVVINYYAYLCEVFCSNDCIRYTIGNNQSYDSELEWLRRLLLEYPNELTALNFVKEHYICYFNNVYQSGNVRLLPRFNARPNDRLEYNLKLIRKDVRHAHKFIEIMQLNILP